MTKDFYNNQHYTDYTLIFEAIEFYTQKMFDMDRVNNTIIYVYYFIIFSVRKPRCVKRCESNDCINRK